MARRSKEDRIIAGRETGCLVCSGQWEWYTMSGGKRKLGKRIKASMGKVQKETWRTRRR